MANLLFIGKEFQNLPSIVAEELLQEDVFVHTRSGEAEDLLQCLKELKPQWVVVSESYCNAWNFREAVQQEAKSLFSFNVSASSSEGEAAGEIRPKKPSFLKTKAKEINDHKDPTVQENKVGKALAFLKQQGWMESVNYVAYLPQMPSNDVVKDYFKAGLSDFVSNVEDGVDLSHRLLVLVRQSKRYIQARELADQINTMNKDLYTRNIQTEQELTKTRKLQHSLLPLAMEWPEQRSFNPYAHAKLHFENEHLRITGLYLPCDALGGDLYDMISFHDESLGVVVSDVSGHGVPAAFVTAMFKSIFYRTTHLHQSPDEVLFHVNNQMNAIVKTGDYLTAVYLHLSPDGKTLQYGGAGHPYPILYRSSSDSIIMLEENGMPLVWVPDMPYGFKTETLQSGDYLFLYTDGITELQNTRDELLGDDAACDILKNAIKSPTGVCDEVLDDVLLELSNFSEGEPLHDDMTMLLIQVK